MIEGELAPINKRHRYLIKRNLDRAYVGSTDNLGEILPIGHGLVDTIGEDGLGAVDGRKGVPDFLATQAASQGEGR